MYTYKLKAKNANRDRINVEVEFNGPSATNLIYAFDVRTKEEFDNTVRSFVANLESRDIEMKKLTLGDFVVAPVVVVVPIAVVQTPSEIAEQKFQDAKSKLTDMKLDVDLGLLDKAVFDVESAKVKALKPV